MTKDPDYAEITNALSMPNDVVNAATIILRTIIQKYHVNANIPQISPQIFIEETDNGSQLVLEAKDEHIIISEAIEKSKGKYVWKNKDRDKTLAKISPNNLISEICCKTLRCLGVELDDITEETKKTHAESLVNNKSKWTYEKLEQRQSGPEIFYTQHITIPIRFTVPLSVFDHKKIKEIITIDDYLRQIHQKIRHIKPKDFRADIGQSGLSEKFKIRIDLNSGNIDAEDSSKDNYGDDINRISEAYERLQYAKAVMQQHLEKSEIIGYTVDDFLPLTPERCYEDQYGVYYHEIDFENNPEKAEIFLAALKRAEQKEKIAAEIGKINQQDNDFQEKIGYEAINKFKAVLNSLSPKPGKTVNVKECARVFGSSEIKINFSEPVDQDVINRIGRKLQTLLRDCTYSKDFYVNIIESSTEPDSNPAMYFSANYNRNTSLCKNVNSVRIDFVHIAVPDDIHGCTNERKLSPDELKAVLDHISSKQLQDKNQETSWNR